MPRSFANWNEKRRPELSLFNVPSDGYGQTPYDDSPIAAASNDFPRDGTIGSFDELESLVSELFDDDGELPGASAMAPVQHLPNFTAVAPAAAAPAAYNNNNSGINNNNNNNSGNSNNTCSDVVAMDESSSEHYAAHPAPATSSTSAAAPIDNSQPDPFT